MTDSSTALLSFLKLSNEIDPRIASFRDIDDPSIFHNIFFSFFKIKCPVEDEQFKTRIMLRWLHEHAPKQLTGDILKQIKVEDFEKCDFDALEQTALLIFACKTRDNAEYKSMIEKLDSSDQAVLESLIELSDEPYLKQPDHQLLSHMAKEIRELSNSFIKLKSVEDEYTSVSKQLKAMEALKKIKIKEEEQEIKKISDDIKSKIISSQMSLDNLEANINQRKIHSSESEEQLLKDYEMSIEDNEKYIFDLNQQNDRLREKIKIARQNTDGIEKLREEVLQHREVAAILRKQYHEICDSVEEVENRVSDVKEKINQKNSALDEEIRNLQEKKESLLKALNENIEKLKSAKQSGPTFDKCVLLKEIREKRTTILGELDQVAKKAKALQDCCCS